MTNRNDVDAIQGLPESEGLADIESLAELAWLEPVRNSDYEEKKINLPKSRPMNVTICGTCM